MKIYLSAKSIPELASLGKAEQKAILGSVAKKSVKHWQTQIAFAIWAAVGVVTIMNSPGGVSGVLLVAVVVYISGFLFCLPYFHFMRRYVIEYVDAKGNSSSNQEDAPDQNAVR